MRFSIPGRRNEWIGFALLAGFALIFFRRASLGGCFYAVDFHLTFEPLRRMLGESMRAGLPVWTSWAGNGAPQFSNPLNAVLYPPNWFFAVLEAAPALTILTVLHVLFGAWGTWRLARRWDSGFAGAWVAAIVFAFNGVAISATSFTNLCWSVAWLPWLILAWEIAATDSAGRWRWLPLAGTTFALLVLGEPFVILPAVLGVALLSVGRLIERGRTTPAAALREVAVFPGIGALSGAILASPSVIATMRYLPESLRWFGFNWEGVTYWSFHPVRLIELLAPGVFGEIVSGGPSAFWAHGLSPERGHPLFFSVYVGSLTLALLVCGVAHRSRVRWPVAAWGVTLWLLAFGSFTPIYTLVPRVPALDALRFPEKWALAAMLPLAVIAGAGVDRLARTSTESSRCRTFIVAALAVLMVAGALSTMASPGLDRWLDRLAGGPAGAGTTTTLVGDYREAVRSVVMTAALRGAIPVILALGVVAFRKRIPNVRAAVWILAVVVSVDLLIANSRQAPTVPTSFYQRVSPAASAILRDDGAVRTYAENPLHYPPGLVRPPSALVDFSEWQRDVFRGYTGVSQGLSMAFGSDTEAFTPGYYARLKILMESAPLRERLMILGSAGVTHLVTHRDLDDPRIDAVATIQNRRGAPQRVYHNRLATTRAWWVGEAVIYDEDQGYMDAVAGAEDGLFSRAVLVDANQRLRSVTDEPRRDSGPVSPNDCRVEIVSDQRGVLTIKMDVPAGYLVVSDTWLPGWRAWVDGENVDVLRANYAFRAVRVPAGSHRVVFRYRRFGA